MNILMLADVFFPDTIGGAGRVLYHLSLELGKMGHGVHILTRKPDSNAPPHQALNAHITVHRFISPRNATPISFLSEFKNSHFLAKELSRRTTFDLICAHQSLVAIGPLLARGLRRIPMLYYFHSPWHEEFLVKKQKGRARLAKRLRAVSIAMRWIERLILFKAFKVIVLSQYMLERVFDIHRYPKERMSRIPGGVDLNRFSLPDEGKRSAKQNLNLPPDKTIFLTVRNLVPRMGLESLIEAFNASKTLRQKGLLLIGGNGFLEHHLRSMTDGFNLQNCIRFLGHIPEEDLPRIYQAADFFVLPTRELEGFGLVILEAMASGTPVLGTPVGAIPEVIGAFDRKLIFQSPGWQDMKTKMKEVVESPEAYSYDPVACRKYVEQNFSWKSVAYSFEQEVLEYVKKIKKEEK